MLGFESDVYCRWMMQRVIKGKELGRKLVLKSVVSNQRAARIVLKFLLELVVSIYFSGYFFFPLLVIYVHIDVVLGSSSPSPKSILLARHKNV